MYHGIKTRLTQSLRHELASSISNFSAYDVPGICTRLGLGEGTENEAFRSKYKYAASRLVTVELDELVEKAHLLLADADTFQLREVIEKIADLERPEITSLTRRRLIKKLSEEPLVSEVDEFNFFSTILPLGNMHAPHKDDNRTLEEFLLQHTIRNDDLTLQERLESLGLLTCSTTLLFHTLEQLTSAEYQSEERQRELFTAISPLLRHDGYTISEVGKISGSPIYKIVLLLKGSPADGDITATLRAFNPDQIGERWQKALDSRAAEPEHAITLARTLLEDVCKWILDEANGSWSDTDDLPKLYKRLAKTLSLAPDDYTEQIFKQILSGCQSVIVALGSLRSKLGDAHSIGPRRVRPAARHAELAVNLSGTMATFLVSTWNERKLAR